MSKAHRGSGIRTEVKILFEATVEGEKVKICKACNAHLKATAAK